MTSNETTTNGPEKLTASVAVATETGETPITEEEAAEIGREMEQSQTYLVKCITAPVEALIQIGKILQFKPSAENSNRLVLYRFLANASMSSSLYESNGHTFSPPVEASCIRAIADFNRTQAALQADGGDEILPVLEEYLDKSAAILESHIPSKVQELLGKTKVKYLAAGDRLSVHNSVQSRLPVPDIRAIGNLFIDAPFPIGSALMGAYMEEPRGGRVYISLYEQPEVFGCDGEMNPIRASIWAVRDDRENWTVE